MSGIYWLASYPKSGNTWLRIFMANLERQDNGPIDINSLEVGPIASSRLWLDELLCFDSADLFPDEIARLRSAVYQWTAEEASAYEYHKTHDAFTYLPAGEPLLGVQATCGGLYIVRNPLDVAISAAHHWGCSIDRAVSHMADPEFSLAGTKKGITFQVPQRLLSWSQHVQSWVDAPHLDCCVIRYEDMLSKPETTFTRAAQFLQLTASAEQIRKAIRFSDFKELAGQEQENDFKERSYMATRFFRSGQSDTWKKILNPTQIAKIINDHADVMARFGYLNPAGSPFLQE